MSKAYHEKKQKKKIDINKRFGIKNSEHHISKKKKKNLCNTCIKIKCSMRSPNITVCVLRKTK